MRSATTVGHRRSLTQVWTGGGGGTALARSRSRSGQRVGTALARSGRGGTTLARSRSRSGQGGGGTALARSRSRSKSGRGGTPLGKVRTGRGSKVRDEVPPFLGWGIPLPLSRDGLPPRIGQQMEYLIRWSMIKLKECGSIFHRLTI